MPRVLKAYNTDYKISVQDGGKITLDTGIEIGDVIITGNLQVQGETTTVDTTNLAIEDNIIVLNRGEQGFPGITEGTAGIEIDRGSLNPAFWVFDESVQWQLGGLGGTGTFYGSVDGQKLPINTPGIVAGGDFYVDTGEGVISVTGTQNYERKVFSYDNAGINIEPAADGSIVLDDDHIPNAKGIADFISYSFANNLQPSIQVGNTFVQASDDTHPILEIISINALGNDTTVVATPDPHGFSAADTLTISGIDGNGDPIEDLDGTDIEIIEIINQFSFRIDKTVTGGDITSYVQNSGTVTKTNAEESKIQITVEGTEVSEFYDDRTRIQDILIADNSIKSNNIDEDLVLSAPGTGTVKIDDALELSSFPYKQDTLLPAVPAEGIKLYTTQDNTSGNFTDQTLGKSGVFFVNSNETRDELISRNRSLLYSMLF
jgi:hypothetical protein